jgi:hypothetical protein
MGRTKYYLVTSKGNAKDKVLPGLATAMERTKYYLVLKEQWKGQNATWSRKSNGKSGSILSLPLLLLDQVVFCPCHCSY